MRAWNAKDITGQRFGKLIALKPCGKYRNEWVWECQCVCGKTHKTRGSYLRGGSIKSCGCAWRERTYKVNKNSWVQLTPRTFKCGHPRAEPNLRRFGKDGKVYACCRTCNNESAKRSMRKRRASGLTHQ